MKMERMEIDVAIMGAGVLGLALAESISRGHPQKTVVVFERHFKYAQEISSHQSEVLHAGLYYEGQPLKTRYCIDGRARAFSFCEKYDVPFIKCGKYLIAFSEEEDSELEKKLQLAKNNGVSLSRVSKEKISAQFEGSNVYGAVCCPETGIADSLELMARLERLALVRGVIFLYKHTFLRTLDVSRNGVVFDVMQPDGKIISVLTHKFFNATGMTSANIANIFFSKEDECEIRPCRGRYFSLAKKWKGQFKHLIYPVPDTKDGLGVHLTVNITGGARLGPDVDWTHEYHTPSGDWKLYLFSETDEGRLHDFYIKGRRFIPGLIEEDLSPDYIGVRPKLFIKGEAYSDFYFKHGPSGCDLHFLGFESPGFTSALSVAEDISSKI